MNVRVAAIQPLAFRGEEENRNESRALAYLDEAADAGAQVAVFPEGYPGPYHGPLKFDPFPALCDKARERGLYVIASKVLQAPEMGPGVFFLALRLISPSGEIEGVYCRAHPNPPGVEQFLMPGKTIAPGEEIPVFQTDRGNFGLQICSELWLPELSRVQALKGANILFAPIGGALYELLPAWRILVQARAMENLAYVVVSQNLWGMEEGLAMIAGPEGVLAEGSGPGVIVADLDLDRLAWLREGEQQMVIPKPYRAIPGILKERRPALYNQLVDPSAPARDFYVFQMAEEKS
ncbi:MAG: carbon-nitrogen hydrolase family protein [Nitrospinota bacterium]